MICIFYLLPSLFQFHHKQKYQSWCKNQSCKNTDIFLHSKLHYEIISCQKKDKDSWNVLIENIDFLQNDFLLYGNDVKEIHFIYYF